MIKIVQTEVDNEAITKIDEEITTLNLIIEDMKNSIEYFEIEKDKLQTTYFCGKKITFEEEKEMTNKRKRYELIVQMSNTYHLRTRAYTDAHDGITFVANMEGDSCDNKTQFCIETLSEAKQICRQWLADLIYNRRSDSK